MNKSDELLLLLESSDLVCQTKKLRKVIENNPLYLKQFQSLLCLQKTMIRKDQSGDKKGFEAAKSEYLKQMDALMSSPAVAEYLNCSEELSVLIKEITEILSDSSKTLFD